ncbi:MAG TPA: phosphoglycolate phosphatase [Candidatus Nitrosopolaris sp.]|nr:phosphoglycolate phosphatase [Candidatus Nitrosopolaris sp.]
MKPIRAFAVDIDGTLTENGCGMVHLAAFTSLRFLEYLGFKVVYVTGRSSIEAYLLALFGGTTKVAIGENGGVVTTGPQDHILLGNKQNCMLGYEILRGRIEGVQIKPVFNRLTEVVLYRNFDIKEGNKILKENSLDLLLTDSKYAYHINERRVDKAVGLRRALGILKVEADETVAIGDSETDLPLFDFCGSSVALSHAEDTVKAKATHVVTGAAGQGLLDAIELVSIKYLGRTLQDDISPIVNRGP